MNGKRVVISIVLISLVTAVLPLSLPMARAQLTADQPALPQSDRAVDSNNQSFKNYMPAVFHVPADAPYLVKNIYPDMTMVAPLCGTTLGQDLICIAYIDGENSLVKTDGTQPGTEKLADIFVYRGSKKWMLNFDDKVYLASSDGLWRTGGTSSSTERFDGRPAFGSQDGTGQFTSAGDLFYFVAGGNYPELWRSNGQVVGTKKIATFADRVKELTPFKGALYFFADDGQHGYELWKSDGTTAGTVMVKDTNPYGSSFPSELTVVGDQLFFSNNEGLWVSDGSSAGTSQIASDRRFSGLVSFQGRLLYWANSFTYGETSQLWQTDGTVTGTKKIVDAPEPYYVTAAETLLYFFPESGHLPAELWRTDGTAEGTHYLHTFPDCEGCFPNFDTYFIDRTFTFGDRLLFTGYDEQHGIELWISDGTESSTKLIMDIYSGPDHSRIFNFQPLDGKIYFPATSGQYDSALWVTNAEAAGTRRAVGLSFQDVHASEPSGLTAVAGQLFFSARDGIHGRELWKSNGLSIGTQLVKDIVPGRDSSNLLHGYPGGVAFADDLIFTLFSGNELWKSDGSEAGTRQIWKFPGTQSARWLEAGDELVYAYAGNELWASTGESGDNTMLAAMSYPIKRVLDGDRLFAVTSDNSLWTSTGTPSSTELLLTRSAAGISELCIFNGIAYFGSGNELWQSDGTIPGTKPALTVAGEDIYRLAAAEGLMYLAVKGKDGDSLWRSDGRTAGTKFLKTINSTTDGKKIYTLQPFGKKVFFVANDGIHDYEPWVSDGTVAGTRLVKDIAAGALSSFPEFITPAGDLLFFSADDEIHGRELWVSDGSGPGTYMVVDMVPPGGGGPDYCPLGGSCPAELTVSGSRLYFWAEDNDGDVELWAYHLVGSLHHSYSRVPRLDRASSVLQR